MNASLEGEGGGNGGYPLHPHCAPADRRKAPPDDRLREAIQSWHGEKEDCITSSQPILGGLHYVRV
jgi:hypothetical protein